MGKSTINDKGPANKIKQGVFNEALEATSCYQGLLEKANKVRATLNRYFTLE